MIPKIKNSRRGIAIELALTFLLLSTLLGTALVSISVLMHENKTERANALTRQIELHMTAEDFIKALREGGDIYKWCDEIEAYTADVDAVDTDGERTVTLRLADDDAETVFTLELRSDDGVTYTVTKWLYK